MNIIYFKALVSDKSGKKKKRELAPLEGTREMNTIDFTLIIMS